MTIKRFELREVREGANFTQHTSPAVSEGLQNTIKRQDAQPTTNTPVAPFMVRLASGEALNVWQSDITGRNGVFTPSQTRISDDELRQCDTLESSGLLVRERTAEMGYTLRHKNHVGKSSAAQTQLLSEAQHRFAVQDRHGDIYQNGRYSDKFTAQVLTGTLPPPPRKPRPNGL